MTCNTGAQNTSSPQKLPHSRILDSCISVKAGGIELSSGLARQGSRPLPEWLGPRKGTSLIPNPLCRFLCRIVRLLTPLLASLHLPSARFSGMPRIRLTVIKKGRSNRISLKTLWCHGTESNRRHGDFQSPSLTFCLLHSRIPIFA